MSSYPTRGAYWGGDHAGDTAPPAATKGAYYYGTAYIKRDIQREKTAKYDGATDEETEDTGMSTLGSCITNTSNNSHYTEVTVGSIGSDESFISAGVGAGTKDKKSGMVVPDVGAGKKDGGDNKSKVNPEAGGGTTDQDVEELESTKTLKARGTQGGGASGIFH